MITMENVLKRGRTVWDRTLLPEDEYLERIRATRTVMRDAGLEGLIVVGHSSQYGNLTYLSGAVPALGWMAVVLGVEGDPILVTGGGSRDLPFLRTQTWFEQIRTSRSLFAGPAEAISGAVTECLPSGSRLGLIGGQNLSGAAHAELQSALGEYSLSGADGLLDALRADKRPRELMALRRALAISRDSAAAATADFDAGSSNSSALLAAERAARLQGARDVRVLGNLNGSWLSPVEQQSDERQDSLVIYCAVEYLGYWAETSAHTPPEPSRAAARRAVDAMVGAASPGASASSAAAAAQAELPVGREDIALSYGLGGGIGLDLREPPILSPGSTDQLLPGTLLSLKAFTKENGVLTCASETIRIETDGVTAL